jgi:RNA recognition motif-containing protein
MKETRLFVGNLSYNTTEDDLRSLFAEAGNITSINLMLDKFTGKSRGFAFIEMSTPEEANKAIELFHGKDLQDRALTVNIARPREDRPPVRSGPREYRGGSRESGGRGQRY